MFGQFEDYLDEVNVYYEQGRRGLKRRPAVISRMSWLVEHECFMTVLGHLERGVSDFCGFDQVQQRRRGR